MATKATKVEALIASATTNQDPAGALAAMRDILHKTFTDIVDLSVLVRIELCTMHPEVRKLVQDCLLLHPEVTPEILLCLTERGLDETLVLKAAYALKDSAHASPDHLLYAGFNAKTPIARMRIQEAMLERPEFGCDMRHWLLKKTEFPKIRTLATGK